MKALQIVTDLNNILLIIILTDRDGHFTIAAFSLRIMTHVCGKLKSAAELL
jgi:hypothetical protein